MLREHLEKVNYFRSICDEGTFRGAAAALHLSQSSLTVAVNKLEAALGQRLLIRTKKGVRMTPAGELLLVFARELDIRVDDLEAKLRAPSDPFAGRCDIGAYDSIAIYWLPTLIRRAGVEYPNLDLSISIGSSLELVQQLKDQVLDLAIVVEPPAADGLISSKLFEDTFSFFGTAKTLKERLDGAARPIIGMLGARVGNDQTLGDCLRRKGVSLKGAVEVESFEIAKALAQQEIGLAVLPHRVAEFSAGKARLELAQKMPSYFGLHRIVLLSQRTPRGLTSINKALIEMMMTVARGGA